MSTQAGTLRSGSRATVGRAAFDRSSADDALEAVCATFPPDVQRQGINRNHAEYRLRVHELLPFVQQGSRVLDVGAGPGVVPLVLARLGCRATALDTWREYAPEYANQMGTAADQIRRLQAAGVATVQHDLVAEARLPFDDGQFDVVTFYDVIEHLPGTPRFVLEEFRRVLKPGGRLVVTTPNLANLRARVWLAFGKTPHFPIDEWYDAHPFFGHIREYTPGELKHVLERAGFRDVALRMSNAMQWNTRRSNGEWERTLRPTSGFQIAKIAYLGLTWLLPSLRFVVHASAVRS